MEAAGSGEHARMHDCHWVPTLFLDFRFSMAELLSLVRLRWRWFVDRLALVGKQSISCVQLLTDVLCVPG